MLTALHIKKKDHKNALAKFFYSLLPDRINVEIKSAEKVNLRTITYISHRDRVNFSKIDALVKAQRNRLLCDENTFLPEHLGYKRFCDIEYKKRLCTNLALELLRECKNASLRVGLVDIDGDFSLYPKFLLKYCDSLSIVTHDTKHYRNVCEELLYDTGVSVVLSRSFDVLKNCDLVIAVSKMDFSVKLSETAILLCVEKPRYKTTFTTIFDYSVNMPEGLKNLCTENLSDTYIMSALYSLCALYELGAYVPNLCVSQNCVHTLSSLKNMMHRRCSKT